MSLTYNGPAKSTPTLPNAREQFTLKFGKLGVFGGTINFPLTKLHNKTIFRNSFYCLSSFCDPVSHSDIAQGSFQSTMKQFFV